jgi:hypothetical protein
MAADGAPDATSSAYGLLFAGFAAGALLGPLLGSVAGGGAVSWLIVGLPAALGFAVLVLPTKEGRDG